MVPGPGRFYFIQGMLFITVYYPFRSWLTPQQFNIVQMGEEKRPAKLCK